ncbi:Golgin subfamily A member 7/ERF4 family-domain-containing protein [Vararia minispora EC-137]|uniref:Golgin subfamily A member 7/ERF4 family-domain-containing protein n=1 Tax=Vararia minispora EC-137 TaxID=1314806 RepID=A0ACB8QTP9_9AGAM|nr:Golgin subfamily A member 7/ERF4 family-domain-containing protein [Vararia minispora EC-137]
MCVAFRYLTSALSPKHFVSSSSATRRTRPPVSAYLFGPPPPDSAYGTDPVGQLGVHHPREILRIERDYSGGEIVQFSPTYPLELEGRITPTQFLETINAFNEILISAYSLRHGFIDNALDIFSLHLSRLVMSTHYDREMKRLKRTMDQLNTELYNPVGLNILWPRRVGFLFLEIEYYVRPSFIAGLAAPLICYSQ